MINLSLLKGRVLRVATSTLIICSNFAFASNDIPTGNISASPGLVKVGTLPTLTWEIKYPSKVKDYVDIDYPGEVIPKQNLKAEIRVLGAGVTSSYADGSHLTFVHTEAYFSYNNSRWSKVFAGTNWDVRQGDVVESLTVKQNRSLRFGARYWFNNRWSNFYSSNDGTNNVRVLVNGDTPPTTYPLSTAPSLEDFIKPYLDSGGRVRIGPMDVIVMMELTHTDAQANQT